MSTLKIAVRLCIRAVTTIFILMLWVMNLKGLKVRSVLKTLINGISIPETAISTNEVTTMKKSIWFHVSLKYAPSPRQNPNDIILRAASIAKATVSIPLIVFDATYIFFSSLLVGSSV